MLIGIGGLSRSGKSTLAGAIQRAFQQAEKSCIILSQDEYVKPTFLIPRIKDRVDWERPDSINWKSLTASVKEATASYDVVIVEGLFAFWEPVLTARYDHKIYLHISKATFLARKAVDDRWGPEPAWFIDHIWESFTRFGKIDMHDPAYLSFHGENPIDVPALMEKLYGPD